MLKEAIPFEYTYFSLEKLEQVLDSCPVAILPTGSLEWHGAHNSLGLDAHSATIVAEMTLIKLNGGALLPTNYAGTYGWSRMPGSFVFDSDLVEELFFQYFREMMKIGFKICVILTGHWGNFQTNALRNAVKRAQEMAKDIVGADNAKDIRCFSFRIVDILPDDYGHAQGLETSIEWAVGEMIGIPLVHPEKFPKAEQEDLRASLYRPYNPKSPKSDPEIFRWQGDFQDPRYCSAERGRKYIDAVSSGLALEILEYLEDIGINYTPPVPIKPPL